jgi:ethanolamine ammonia-lyase small subunit
MSAPIFPSRGRVVTPGDPSSLIAAACARTPARVLVGRAGASYRTGTQLDLRRDHAAAVDAVRDELDLHRDLGADFVARWSLVEVRSQARDKAEYLARPDLGRRFAAEAATGLSGFPRGADLQVAVGDGLSAAAVAAQVPQLLPLLIEGATSRGWTCGRPFFIRYCRVGILNAIGSLLDPVVAVLLIGERPGLAAADSLSAYLAYRPRPGHTDAQRNLISNIHGRGTTPAEAAARVLRLASAIMRLGRSGVSIKEGADTRDLPTAPLP